MSAPIPLTREEVLETVEKAMKDRFHAKIIVIRECKLPGAQQYSSEGAVFGLIVDRPNAETYEQDSAKIEKAIETKIEAFKAAHLPKPATVPPTTQPNQPLDPAKILNPEQMEVVEHRKLDDVIIVRPKYWIGDELWRSIHDKLYAAGFRWISAGKDSHWEIRG